MRLLRNIMLIASIAILLLYVFLADEFTNVVSAIASLKFPFLLLAAVFSFLSLFADATAKHLLRRRYQKPVFAHSLYNVFFSFASSNLIPAILHVGVTAEAALMTRQGLRAGEAGSVLLYKQAVAFIAATVFPLAMTLASWDYFSANAGSLLMVFFAMGLAFNALTSLFYAFVGTWGGFLFAIAKAIIRAGSALHIVKDKDMAFSSAKETITSLGKQMRGLPFSLSDGVLTFALSVAQSALGCLVSYAVAASLGIFPQSSKTFMAACLFVSVIQSALPLPGGIGIVEISYLRILSALAGGKAGALMLIWRLVSFYLPAFISIIVMSVPFRFAGRDGSSST